MGVVTMRILAFVLLLLFTAYPGFAATREAPAYRMVRLEPQWHWQDGLVLRFPPDEAACKKAYGKRWAQKCAGPLGTPGAPAKGIAMTPQARGAWQWTDPYEARFMPAPGTHLLPGNEYRVDLSGLALPAWVELPTRQIARKTPALSAKVSQSRFWLDPAPAAQHRLHFSIDFNFPVAADRFAVNLTMPADAKAGPMETVWSADRDRVSMSWPITKLPSESSLAQITLKDIRQAVETDSGIRILPSGAAVFKQALPGQAEIFTIESARVVQEKDANLDSKYFLEIKPSLYTDPEHVAAKILLVELPEFKSAESVTPYDWQSAPAIKARDLAAGRRLKVTATNRGPQSLLRYELPARSGRHVFIGLDKEIQAASGQSLARVFTSIVRANPLEAQLGFLQPGNILPGRGEIGIFGTGLDEVKWQLQQVEEPFLALLASASENSFANPLAASSLAMESISRSVSCSMAFKSARQGEAVHAVLNPAEIMRESFGKEFGLARIVLTGWKNGEQIAEASRLILATDLALIAKRTADAGLDCFVQSIESGQPLADIEIAVLGANGREIRSGKADRRGHIRFDSLKGLVRESRPVALVARGSGGLAWLPLNERSRELDYSTFETGGRTSASDTIAFVFGQRGIYRPGEILHFGCLVRRGDFSPLAPNLKLYGEILNPAGRKIWETSLLPGVEGISEVSWPSLPESQSGKYTFNVRIARDGDVIGSAEARIEAFQPETLKLRVMPPETPGWIVPADGKAYSIAAELRNLYGSPAKGHRIKSEIHVQPASFRFQKYPEYTFTDPAPFLGSGFSRRLPEGKSDSAGHADFNLPADIGSASARVSVACEGYNLSGNRATAGTASFLVSPARKILGYRQMGAFTNADFIEAGSPAQIELLAIDSQLVPVAWRKLQFTLLGRQYITSLVSDGNGGYRYDETPQEIVLRSWSESIPEKPFAVSLPTDRPGEFLLQIRDPEGAIIMRLPYNVAGDRLADPDEPLAGSKMRMKLSGQTFRAGEEIQVSCALPYAAAGLIAIERDGVEAFEWIEGHAGDNIFKIRLPENFEGRGYVTATLMRRDSAQPAYINPLAWAACPFSASMEKRNIGLKIATSGKMLPGGVLKVDVSSEKPGRALVMAVDEGVLQLTGWQNPNPVAELLGNRALSVTTLQIADLLMPSYARLARRGAAFGGGADSGSPFGARFRNPFQRRNEPPLAFWSGIVETGPRAASVEIPVPAWYSGAVRLVAIGAGETCAGMAATQATVAGPIVLSPQLPGFVAPGDEFGGFLVVANTTAKPARIDLNMQIPEGVRLLEGLPKFVDLPAGGELAVPFRLAASDVPGAVTFKFRASSREYESVREVSLSIRPASPLRTTLQAGLALSAGNLEPGRAVYPYQASSEVLISGMPLPLGFSLACYLETYPHGCTEQLISRAFAVILLHNWPQARVSAEKGAKLLNSTIDAIASRFNGQYVALWPQGEGNLLLTAYAADFLLALRESGLGNADALLKNLCDSIRWNCALNEPTLPAARASAYALWVLAREGRIVTQQLEELEAALENQGVAGWQRDIAGALLAAVKKEMAIDALPDFEPQEIAVEGWFDDYAQKALVMTILARYFPDSLSIAKKQDFFDESIRTLNSGGYSTWSAAQGIRALSGLAGALAPELPAAALACLDGDASLDTSLDAGGKLLSAQTERCSQYRLTPGQSPLYWQVATTGYDASPASEATANGIEISRVYLDRDGREVTSAKLGDEIRVRVTARSEVPLVEDCVISDLLPGCLEQILTGNEKAPEGAKYLDFLEDRVLLFANLRDQPLVLEYRCRVVAPGSFLVPPISAEAMYDNQLHGSGKSDLFRVDSE